MDFSSTYKRFLNTFHDCCLIRVNALLALRSFEKENNFFNLMNYLIKDGLIIAIIMFDLNIFGHIHFI